MADAEALDTMALPNVKVFNCIASGRTEELSGFCCEDLRPYLPSLACCALSRGIVDENKSAAVSRVLLNIPEAGRVTSYFKTDIELLKRSPDKKGCSAASEGEGGAVCAEFESLDVLGKLVMLAGELECLLGPSREKARYCSELLDCESLRSEVSDMLCSLVLRLPRRLPAVQLVEALLQTRAPPSLLLQLLANLPLHFQRVVDALVVAGETQDEVSSAGRHRTALLRRLCAFNPTCSSRAQQAAILSLKQPSLVLYLGLDQAQAKPVSSLLMDPVLLTLSRVVLRGSGEVRAWFGQYIKLNRHKYRRMYPSALTLVRNYLASKMAVYESQLWPPEERSPTPRPQQEAGLGGGAEGEELDSGRVGSEEEMETDLRGGMGAGPVAAEEEFPPSSVSLSSQSCRELGLVVKVFCGLKLCGLYVWRNEGYTLLKIITGLAPPPTNCGVRLTKVLFASLLTCSFLLSTKKREEAVLRWFQWLQLNQHHYDSARCGSYGDMLLMAAIHFQDRRTSLIQQLVSSILGTPVQGIRVGKHADLRDLFLSVFTDQVVCTQALRVPPTPGLNSKMTGFYPIHCVYNLLKSHSFSNHSISVTEWVCNQMLTSLEPLHPLLPQVVEELVAAILVSPGRSMYQDTQAVFSQPLVPEHLLLEGVGSADSAPVVKVMVVYYVLSYYQKWLKSLKSYCTWSGAPPPSYSPLLITALPVKKVVAHMRAQRDHYACLYPAMIKLVSTHMPHVVTATHWCCDVMPTSVQPALSTSLVSSALKRCAGAPCQALVVVRKLLLLPPSLLTTYTQPIVEALSAANMSCVPRPLQEGLCRLWETLNGVSTEILWVDTVNVLCRGDEPYSLTDLVQDPLLALRCDPQLMQCPPLVEVLLRVLSGLLALCRVWVEQQGCVQSHTPSPALLPPADKEAVIQSYSALQDSAAVQMLLESCLQLSKSGDCYGSLLSSSREVQCIVCSFIHQMFIATPLLAKLVHFQGYPSVLIDMMVEGVPSMHICLDFIGELLDRPQLKAQQFALQLTARLLAQFPLASASDRSQVFMKKLNTMMETVPRQAHVEVFAPLFPFLLPLCQSLPPLVQEVVLFLLRLARRHTLEEPSSTAARALDNSAVQQAICQLFSCQEQRCSREHVRQDRNAMTSLINQTFMLVSKSIVCRV